MTSPEQRLFFFFFCCFSVPSSLHLEFVFCFILLLFSVCLWYLIFNSLHLEFRQAHLEPLLNSLLRFKSFDHRKTRTSAQPTGLCWLWLFPCARLGGYLQEQDSLSRSWLHHWTAWMLFPSNQWLSIVPKEGTGAHEPFLLILYKMWMGLILHRFCSRSFEITRARAMPRRENIFL